MSNSLPYMKWYPRDFAAATATWNFQARAVYRELLDLQWEVGYIPDDPKSVLKRFQIHPKWWRCFAPYLNEKFPTIDGNRRNPRLHEMRTEALRLAAIRANAGRKGGQKSQANAIPNAQANAQANARANATPFASHPEPVYRTGSSSSDVSTGRRPSRGAPATASENGRTKNAKPESLHHPAPDRNITADAIPEKDLIRKAIQSGPCHTNKIQYLKLRYSPSKVDVALQELGLDKNGQLIEQDSKLPSNDQPQQTNGELEDDIPF